MNEKTRIPVLIVDGMNNHGWARTTANLKTLLEHSGMFAVDVCTSPTDDSPQSAWEAWRPPFDAYAVVIQSFNGGGGADSRHWPEPVQQALEQYVSAGGGLVIFHAANNAFRNWPAYNEMIGLGWRDRDFGPGLIVSDEREVVPVPVGEGIGPGHGPDHAFVVEVLAHDHPICQGLPPRWLHTSDQLSHGQRGPAKNMTVLTYAYSRDSGQNEVIEWVVPFGEGRVYTTMLGHIWDGAANIAVRCVGFQTTFIRGVEWAATGRVTYPIPEAFPTPEQVLLAEVPAEEPVTWLDLLDAHSFAYWQPLGGGTTHEWAQVGGVAVDPEAATRFVTQPGRGVLYNGPAGDTADIYTVYEHGDCTLHAEFVVPQGSNSGIYLMGRYEIQILDSWGETDLKFGTCGGIYARYIDGVHYEGSPPRVNASRPPGEWQTYDIRFRAPRFDASGNKVSNALFEQVIWNGQLVQENVELSGPTRGPMFEGESPTGPLRLQGDHGPVAFRQLILRPLVEG